MGWEWWSSPGKEGYVSPWASLLISVARAHGRAAAEQAKSWVGGEGANPPPRPAPICTMV